MVKKILKSNFAMFSVASALALTFTFFSKLPAQAQIAVDGRLTEYQENTVPELAYGTIGPVVEDVQIFLDELGYYDGVIDGIYGENTQAAIGAFQRDYGLAETGYVDYNTWGTLFGIDPEGVFEDEDSYDPATGEYYDYEEGLI